MKPLACQNFEGYEQNEYGTWMARFVCQTCGDPFTVTPVPATGLSWSNCLAEWCDSYSLERDPVAMQLLGEAGSFMKGMQA